MQMLRYSKIALLAGQLSGRTALAATPRGELATNDSPNAKLLGAANLTRSAMNSWHHLPTPQVSAPQRKQTCAFPNLVQYK